MRQGRIFVATGALSRQDLGTFRIIATGMVDNRDICISVGDNRIRRREHFAQKRTFLPVRMGLQEGTFIHILGLVATFTAASTFTINTILSYALTSDSF